MVPPGVLMESKDGAGLPLLMLPKKTPLMNKKKQENKVLSTTMRIGTPTISVCVCAW